MILEKDGQRISLDNENHIEAFLKSGWAEVKESSAENPPKEEKPVKRQARKKKEN